MAFAEQFTDEDLIVLEADADLSAKQFYFTKLSTTDGQVRACTGTDDIVLGILTNDPDAAGEPAEVLPVGCGRVAKLTVDGNAGAIAVGDRLDTNAAGKGIKKAAGHFNAIALEASTAATDVIPVVMIVGNSTKV